MRCELWDGVYLIGAGRFGYTHVMNCNVYAVVGSKGVALIDAGCGFGGNTLLDSLRAHGVSPADVTMLVLTHTHWDHARGAAALKRATGARLVVHEAGRSAVEVGPWLEVDGVTPVPLDFEPVDVDDVVVDGDQLDLGDRCLGIHYTPGHSADSISLLCEVANGATALFSGDAVMAGGTPGITTAETDFKAYRDSVRRLAGLSVTALLPGHGAFVLEGAAEQIEYLATQLNSKWVNVASLPYPPPFNSGGWFWKTHPEVMQ